MYPLGFIARLFFSLVFIVSVAVSFVPAILCGHIRTLSDCFDHVMDASGLSRVPSNVCPLPPTFMPHTPERLNLWDRLFNRTRKEVADRGRSEWKRYDGDTGREITTFYRTWVDYRVIDRLTGSETIEREYLS